MIAKVIAHGRDRGEALDRLAKALGETVVAGPRSNTAFLKNLVSHADFRAGRFDTGFIDRHLAQLTKVDPNEEAGAIASAVQSLVDGAPMPANDAWADPWAANDGFSLGGARALDLDILVDGAPAKAVVAWGQGGLRVAVNGTEAAGAARVVPVEGGMIALARGVQRHVALKSYDTIDIDHLDGDGTVKAPMHGKVLAIFVEPGAAVTKGERVAIVEAMKMEHALVAPMDGTVTDVSATVGAQVAEGAKILTIGSPPNA
jgi:3-methylcrotonyl-CoA carboxylase alpha subunit